MNPENIIQSDYYDPFLDKAQDIEIHDSRDLPHWNQEAKLQFVTFRLVDSLPQSKINELKSIKARFIQENPKPWTDKTLQLYYKLLGPIENKLLDEGFGSCILKRKEIRDIVSNSILYFDNVRYEIVAFVIMPNHVHLLIRLLGKYTIAQCMHSIKSYSAKMINHLLKHSGSIWMKEYFDRIVRSKEHLQHCINYIIDNPRFLKENEYELYVNPEVMSAGGRE